MTLILQTSLFISLFTLGLYYLSLKGWPLWFYRWVWYKVLGIKYNAGKDETDYPNEFIHQLSKPIITCPPCMCSFNGIIISVLLSRIGIIIPVINEYLFYGIAIFIAASLNRIITELV